jgi:hypothetical protein
MKNTNDRKISTVRNLVGKIAISLTLAGCAGAPVQQPRTVQQPCALDQSYVAAVSSASADHVIDADERAFLAPRVRVSGHNRDAVERLIADRYAVMDRRDTRDNRLTFGEVGDLVRNLKLDLNNGVVSYALGGATVTAERPAPRSPFDTNRPSLLASKVVYNFGNNDAGEAHSSVHYNFEHAARLRDMIECALLGQSPREADLRGLNSMALNIAKFHSDTGSAQGFLNQFVINPDLYASFNVNSGQQQPESTGTVFRYKQGQGTMRVVEDRSVHVGSHTSESERSACTDAGHRFNGVQVLYGLPRDQLMSSANGSESVNVRIYERGGRGYVRARMHFKAGGRVDGVDHMWTMGPQDARTLAQYVRDGQVQLRNVLGGSTPVGPK